MATVEIMILIILLMLIIIDVTITILRVTTIAMLIDDGNVAVSDGYVDYGINDDENANFWQ